MELYYVAILLHPTKKQMDEDGEGPKIIVQPIAVLAKDREQAAMRASKFIPDEHADKGSRLEVKLLPFGK